ncbi:MAG: hypothetical protein ACRDJ9_07605 [Dehalococcoidia bacterium]
MKQLDHIRNAPPSIIAVLIGLVRPTGVVTDTKDPEGHDKDVGGFGAQQAGSIMTSEHDEPVSGTLMCEADGTLSFIPDTDLAAYRLAEEDAGQVRALLDGRSDVGGYALRESSQIAILLPAPHNASTSFYDLLISSVRSVTIPAMDGASKDSAY